ncbi:TetR/AcrR family transcriptional regulator [Stackebrandtia nassauensis]|nr:TetR/AcrR family transcriptional regulator [Stackebrandtia nassauensis]
MATALRLLPEHGPDMPMEELARAAEVGVGTLYRRFGGREQLIEACAAAAFTSVTTHAQRAEAETDGWSALSTFILDAAPDLMVVGCLSTWYPDSWRKVKASQAEQHRRSEIMAVLDRLVRQAQEQGRMRDDVDVDDVAMMLALVLRPIPGRTDTLDATRRYVSLMLDGLRTRP